MGIPEWNKMEINYGALGEIMNGQVTITMEEHGRCTYIQRSEITLDVEDIFDNVEDLPVDMDNFETVIRDYIYENNIEYDGEVISTDYEDEETMEGPYIEDFVTRNENGDYIRNSDYNRLAN
jgi:hypothetical protein